MGFPGHAFRKQAAGAFGPELAKKLSQLVKMEKNVMRSMELVGKERMEVAVCEHEVLKVKSDLLM
jgi:sphingolipid long chain base-responsive protein PIL1/LSP1